VPEAISQNKRFEADKQGVFVDQDVMETICCTAINLENQAEILQTLLEHKIGAFATAMYPEKNLYHIGDCERGQIEYAKDHLIDLVAKIKEQILEANDPKSARPS
jgi:hypothetical protein